jgi:hypothetical protein
MAPTADVMWASSACVDHEKIAQSAQWEAAKRSGKLTVSTPARHGLKES